MWTFIYLLIHLHFEQPNIELLVIAFATPSPNAPGPTRDRGYSRLDGVTTRAVSTGKPGGFSWDD